ncbi:MAG TPA: hypothetical protein VFH44_11725, partial [Solirubrobacterales bacterium]|nr:hypothetical protein [Solirubrobacterales bacterium]
MGTSRLQIAVFAAIGIVLLLLGVRAVRDAGAAADGGSPAAPLATEPVGGGDAAAAGGDVVVHV